MQMTQEKIVKYVVAKYGGDIMNELQNQTPVVIDVPEYSGHIKARHTARVMMVHAQQANMLSSHQAKKAGG